MRTAIGYRNRYRDIAEQRFLIGLYVYAGVCAVAFAAMLLGDLATMLLALITVLIGGTLWLAAVLVYMVYTAITD